MSEQRNVRPDDWTPRELDIWRVALAVGTGLGFGLGALFVAILWMTIP